MFEIKKIRRLAENAVEFTVYAPLVTKNAHAGQFIILRTDEEGERVPFTICDFDKAAGTVTILVQKVGATTEKLCAMKEGDSLAGFVGPLGNPTDLSSYEKIVLVGGGIGVAVIYPQAKHLKSVGKKPTVIVGARDASLVMYEREFSELTDELHVMTDNGTKGEKGFVTDKLAEILESGNKPDAVFAVGPVKMMKAVCDLTRGYGIPTVVSMNSIMLDGTGMCGCCRVTVDGKIKYACVDGPEFDGHKVDFDEAINRLGVYREIENEHLCRLRNKVTGEI